MLVAAAIPYTAIHFPSASTWEDLRNAKVSIADLDTFISAVPNKTRHSEPVAKLKNDMNINNIGQLPESGTSDSSQSSSDESSNQGAHSEPSAIEWFVQPGRSARAHIQRYINSNGKRLSFCRQSKPFFRNPASSGDGLVSAAQWQGGVCDTCLAQMPPGQASEILAAIFAAAKRSSQ